MSSREHYTVTQNSLAELAMQLNFALARIADRLDKVEGARGNPEFLANVDMLGHKITEARQGTQARDGVILSQLPDQGVSIGDGPVFQNLTLVDNVSIGGTLSSTGDIKVYDANNQLIHSFEVGA